MEHRKLTETEMLVKFDRAVRDGHIFPFYQPQYNHSTGRMIGAEALMRWDDPECGIQSPVDFIPVLENYRLIRKADLCVVKHICIFLKNCLDNGILPVPISFNISRYDILDKNFVEDIEKIRIKYGVPVKYLRAEITESSAIGGMELITSVLNKLHDCGYIVEMDDFGSGYSSLNVLKDLPVDIIKLDMRFLSGDLSGRGGIIIGSMVQMAKWLNAATIAEGVESIEHADFMKSLGCCYVQGYLYSKPVREEEFSRMLKSTPVEHLKFLESIRIMDTKKFWNPDSRESLIFSEYSGPAALLTYYPDTGKVELLRVNSKYIRELGMNMDEDEMINADHWSTHDELSKKTYVETIKRAIETGEEETCEAWWVINSKCCGSDMICIESSIRLIGFSEDQVMLFTHVRNITAEKKAYEKLQANEQKLRHAAELVNVYAWEYDIATREMRPCSRCMRDLGLPALLENYPEPVIESGLFPADYADMYRDWHRKLAEGVGKLEAVIPLTADRIPFHVRYETEFDEAGRPYKAYGSAALVVDMHKN